MIRFRVDATPVAQPRQRHRIMQAAGRTFAHNYTPSKHPVQDFKYALRQAAKEALNGQLPAEGAVGLCMVILMPRPQAMRWKTRPQPRCPHIKKPDIDNIEKAVLDALKGLLWHDDSQVALKESRKEYAAGDESPGVIIAFDVLSS